MLITELDRLEPATAADLLRPVVGIDRWVADLVAGRPYRQVAALVAAAQAHATTWTPSEIEAALADHPRIGERPAGDGTGARMSRTEQAGVGDDPELRARLAEGNRRYEERFGRIYLVRAAGRDAEQLLALLEERLGHDDASELEATREQLAEIAVLRLRGLVDDPPEENPEVTA